MSATQLQLSQSTKTYNGTKRLSYTHSQDQTEEQWESHILMRFPNDVAKTVDQIVSEDAHANDRLAINFDGDMRNGSVRVDNRQLNFKVYDLPCVTEVMKTVDKKTFYKVGDLSQMILCSTSTAPHRDVLRARRWSGGSSTASEAPNATNKEYRWPHGLAPPMKNARKRRFRKTKKKKYMDAPDVERELKRLLRSDVEAHTIHWEVVPIEQKDPVGHSGRSAGACNAKEPVNEELTQERLLDHLLDSLSDSGNEDETN